MANRHEAPVAEGHMAAFLLQNGLPMSPVPSFSDGEPGPGSPHWAAPSRCAALCTFPGNQCPKKRKDLHDSLTMAVPELRLPQSVPESLCPDRAHPHSDLSSWLHASSSSSFLPCCSRAIYISQGQICHVGHEYQMNWFILLAGL